MIETLRTDGISDDTGRALQLRLAAAQHDGRVPSVVAAVARRGDPLWFGATGTLDGAPAGPSPIPATQYRIGSITKTTVAVLVLRLVEAGEVGLDDPIGDHLPGAPAPTSTVRQLLSHTAGLASETPPPWWERTDGAARPRLTDVLSADPLRHTPGSVFHYSNPGFGLLGELVSSKVGRPWFDELREQVLDPLNMQRTSYHPTDPHAAGWAVHPWADVLLPEPAHDHGLLAGAGQLWSTPADLCRFGVFLGGPGNGIVNEQTLAMMRKPASGPTDDGWTGGYGLGIQLFRTVQHGGADNGDELITFGHSGSMPGFVAMCITSAEHGLTVALQANAWAELAAGTVAHDLLRIVRDREPTMPEPWHATRPGDAAWEIVGPWYWGAVAMSIRAHNEGHLELGGMARAGRTGRFLPAGDGRWVGEPASYYHGEYLEVRRDEAGTITHLDLGSFVLTRAPYAPSEVVPDGLGRGDWQR